MIEIFVGYYLSVKGIYPYFPLLYIWIFNKSLSFRKRLFRLAFRKRHHKTCLAILLRPKKTLKRKMLFRA